jgi:hypothetical protein
LVVLELTGLQIYNPAKVFNQLLGYQLARRSRASTPETDKVEPSIELLTCCNESTGLVKTMMIAMKKTATAIDNHPEAAEAEAEVAAEAEAEAVGVVVILTRTRTRYPLMYQHRDREES